MANIEIKHRTLNMYDNLIWKYWLKHSVIVPWPRRKWVELWDDGSGGSVSMESSDPNVHYRSFLEKYCGKQNIAWNWRQKIGSSVIVIGYEDQYNDMLEVKFRKKSDAVHFALKYA